MDIADKAEHQEAQQRQKAIEAARLGGCHLPGPHECMRCGHPNDRRDDGYGVCSSCVEDGGA